MRKIPTFEEQVCAWLDDCLKNEIPTDVRAFAFGINERELCFVIELNGTSEFNHNCSSWTWSEFWHPSNPKLCVPTTVSCGQRKRCSMRLKVAIMDYIKSGIYAQRLTNREGIAIQTLDEGFELISYTSLAPRRRIFNQ